MLDEARADNKENDLEYLKPSKKLRCQRSFLYCEKFANGSQSILLGCHARLA
jgi:hypothetical protein